LAVTSIDSGVPRLAEQQKSAGWEVRGGVAYSRAIQSTEELFYQRDGLDCPGYDEWYVFETPVDLGEMIMHHPFIGPDTTRPDGAIVFVNYPFTIDGSDSLYDVLRELFWEQIERVRPES
jgi:hypothetical protein